MCYYTCHGDFMKKEILPLSTTDGRLYIIPDKIKQNAEELEEFLSGNNYMNSKKFSENVLFSQEIKTNNSIEGYNDDISLVDDIVKKKLKIKDKDKMYRIRNLYDGYRFILGEKEINKENLRHLYNILSNNLLDSYEIDNMGKFYRNKDVFIYFSSNMDVEPDKGYNPEEIEKYMDEYFDYIHGINMQDTMTSHFVKSQIMHFQFVNIHPYFDINGRTSRTTAMWYLLNNKAYPYIIFNRGITLNKNKYYKVIMDVKKYHNVTFFVNYMLDNVRVELEKEYIIDMIKSISGNLTAVDYQTIYYILSMNGKLTAKDFMTFYNRNNDKKSSLDIYSSMLVPLLDRHIIVKERYTQSGISSHLKNFEFRLNDSMYEKDAGKIKRLKRSKFNFYILYFH